MGNSFLPVPQSMGTLSAVEHHVGGHETASHVHADKLHPRGFFVVFVIGDGLCRRLEPCVRVKDLLELCQDLLKIIIVILKVDHVVVVDTHQFWDQLRLASETIALTVQSLEFLFSVFLSIRILGLAAGEVEHFKNRLGDELSVGEGNSG